MDNAQVIHLDVIKKNLDIKKIIKTHFMLLLLIMELKKTF